MTQTVLIVRRTHTRMWKSTMPQSASHVDQIKSQMQQDSLMFLVVLSVVRKDGSWIKVFLSVKSVL